MGNGRQPNHLVDPALWQQFLADFRLTCTAWQLSESESCPATGQLVFWDEAHHHGLELQFRQRKSWHISLGAVTWFEIDRQRHSWRVNPRSLGQVENHVWYLSDTAQIPNILQEFQQEIAALYEPFWQTTVTPAAAIRWVLDSDPEVKLVTAHTYGTWHKARLLLQNLSEQEQQVLAPEFEEKAAKLGVKWLR